MNFEIENEFLKVVVNSMGAELLSCFNKQNKTEYIWQANPAYWAKHAPILFPVIGKVYGDKIKVDGKEYPMPKHGFAREMNFELHLQSATVLEFLLSANQQTKKSYPFNFDFLVRYEINEKCLKTSFIVKNKGENEMHFSLGGHPAFNCPIEVGDKLENCYLKFSETECDDRVLINANGFRTGEVVKNYLQGDVIHLSNELFTEDALVFFKLKSKQISIKSKNNALFLNFSYNNFPFMGIWSPVAAPFVCLEPWIGVCDEEGFRGELKDKKGVNSLLAGKEFTCNYCIEV